MSDEFEFTFKTLKLKPKHVIYHENKDKDGFFYLIKSGKIKLRNSLNLPYLKKELETGDIFGLIESLIYKEKLFTAVAVSECELLKINYSHLPMLVKNDLSIINKLITEFSELFKILSINNLTKNNTNSENLYLLGNYFTEKDKIDRAYYCFNTYIRYFPDNINIAKVLTFLKKHKNEYDWVLNPKNKPNSFLKHYKSGTYLFTEFEPSTEFYIVKEGKVKISKIIDNIEIMLSIIEKGFILGEMCILNKKPRIASAIAMEDTTCFVVNKNNFDEIFTINPSIAMIILTKYSDQLWKLYRKLENKLIQSTEAKIFDRLYFEMQNKNIFSLNLTSYTFDITVKELINEYCVDMATEKKFIKKIFYNKSFIIKDNHITLNNLNIIRILIETYKTNENKKIFNPKNSYLFRGSE